MYYLNIGETPPLKVVLYMLTLTPHHLFMLSINMGSTRVCVRGIDAVGQPKHPYCRELW